MTYAVIFVPYNLTYFNKTRIKMKTKARDTAIVASIKGSVSLHVRVVRSKKIYTRKQKHPKDIRRPT